MDKSNRRELIKKYSSVVEELPLWAKETLGSSMGSVYVSARDSFEIYFNNLKDLYPEDDFVIFRKRFVEIYQEKGNLILKKLSENRKKYKNHYFTNDYFWQEFRCLFLINKKRKKRGFRPSNGYYFGETGNRGIATVAEYNKAAKKVGLVGIGAKRNVSNSKRHKRDEYSIRGR